eukprot:scaffold20641_cov61-Phaeocystis_antarctica.AAC.2
MPRVPCQHACATLGGQDGRQGSRSGDHPSPHYQKGLSRRDSEFLENGTQRRQPSQGTLGRSQTARGGFSPPPWLAPRAGGKMAPGAPLRTAGRDEDFTASGLPPMSG